MQQQGYALERGEMTTVSLSGKERNANVSTFWEGKK
jgi:hypothetical protein